MSVIKIRPLGGLGEIGLNCMVFEHKDEIIVADCGVMFSDLQLLGVDFQIPDMTYLKDNASRVKGYVITHAHEDHIGALPYAMRVAPAPIYATNFASKLIEAKMTEHDLKPELRVFAPGQPMRFEHFTVTATPVNHSIVEAMALLIDTPLGKIVFTGDFKIDASPYYGEPLDPVPFQAAGKEGVLLLMSDSTNVERDGHSLSEERIYHKFEELFSKAQGLTIIALFASNIGRVGQIVELAKKLGKKIALLGRSMEQNTRVAFEAGYLEGLNDVLIPLEALELHPRRDVIVVSTGSQGETRSALMRIANNEQKIIKARDKDVIIMSSRSIPGNEKSIGRMVNALFKLGADVLYESVHDIHVSGHANAGELRAMLKMTKPKFFIPVHGEYRHLVKHARLARECGVASGNALIAVNGDVLELTKDRLVRTEHLEENRIFVDGLSHDQVSKVVIKDRRKLAETGVVFCIVTLSAGSGRLVAGPELVSRGMFEEGGGGDLLERAQEIALAIMNDVGETAKAKKVDLQEEIRVGLRRYFHSRLGRKPVVVPVIVEA